MAVVDFITITSGHLANEPITIKAFVVKKVQQNQNESVAIVSQPTAKDAMTPERAYFWGDMTERASKLVKAILAR